MKYVFWGPGFRPMEAMLNDIWGRDDVRKVKLLISDGIFVKIYKDIRCFRVFQKKYLKRKISSYNWDENVVFVIIDPWIRLFAEEGFVETIKKVNPNIFVVAMITDVMQARAWDIDYLKNSYDSIYTYDEDEANRLELEYFPPMYSKNYEIPQTIDEQIDVSYVGHVKDRMSEIMDAYERLSSIGLTCKFYLVGVPKYKRIKKSGVVYADKYLTEKRYFEDYIKPAKCLLEIKNKGTNAITARVREAVIYEKKLLSNLSVLKEYKYYNDKMMMVYENVEQIVPEFFFGENVSYNYEGDYSSQRFLEILEKDYSEVYKKKDRRE